MEGWVLTYFLITLVQDLTNDITRRKLHLKITNIRNVICEKIMVVRVESMALYISFPAVETGRRGNNSSLKSASLICFK